MRSLDNNTSVSNYMSVCMSRRRPARLPPLRSRFSGRISCHAEGPPKRVSEQASLTQLPSTDSNRAVTNVWLDAIPTNHSVFHLFTVTKRQHPTLRHWPLFRAGEAISDRDLRMWAEKLLSASLVWRRLEDRIPKTVSNWRGGSFHPARITLRANSARYLVPWKTVGPMRRAAARFGFSPRSRWTRYSGKDRDKGAQVRMPQLKGS